MTLRLIAMAFASVTFLASVWLKHRRLMKGERDRTEQPGRGVVGEAVTAFEDVGREFGNIRSAPGPRTEPAGEIDRHG